MENGAMEGKSKSKETENPDEAEITVPSSHSNYDSSGKESLPGYTKYKQEYLYTSNGYSNQRNSGTNLPCCGCMSKRYIVAVLSFFGFFNVYCLRVDLSVALVAMTNNHTRIKLDGEQYEAGPEFNWDTKLQGHILGSFYYGYLITQIPGGYLAAKYGGTVLFGVSILVASLLTMATPWACRIHYILLILLRIFEGICEGCIYPCMYAIWSKWAPPLERSRLTTIPHAGSYAGAVAGTLISGFLCEIAGWVGRLLCIWILNLQFLVVSSAIGFIGVLWSIIWLITISDSPALDKHISLQERIYIEKSLQNDHTSFEMAETPPWCMFFTSLPFWAILVAHTSEGWGFSTLQTSLPKYFSEGLNFRISLAGVLSAILYLMMGLVVLIGGQFADMLRQRNLMSTTNVRKVFTCTGFSLQALAFAVSVHIEDIKLGVFLLIVGGGIEGLAWAGFAVNHLDIAPRYASILFGITNTMATIPGILSPLMVGYVTGNKTQEEWKIVFYIGSATFLFGSIFYALFGSAERQSWADVGNPYQKVIDEQSELDDELSTRTHLD